MAQRQDFLSITRKSMSLILCALCFTSINLAQVGWEAKTAMPTARGFLSTSVVDGKIYAIGGALGPFTGSSAVEEYDPVTDTWIKKNNMPETRSDFSTCVINGKIYAIGGAESPYGALRSSILIYDPITDNWVEKTQMPTPRQGLSASVVDGKIYTIGGATAGVSAVLSTVEVYDPAADTWTQKTDMPTARCEYGTSVVDGKIYIIGGTTGSPWSGLSLVEVYDPATDNWEQKSNMPTARWGIGSAEVNAKIYVTGGASPGVSGVYNTVEVYDPATDMWVQKTDMPTARRVFSASVVNGKVYTIGGVAGAQGSAYALATVEAYTPFPTSNIEAGNVSGTWTKNSSPYYVNGEITIPDGSTLTIKPGVEVIFTGHYKFNVEGRLLAIGTEADTIVFTINDTTGFHNVNIPDGGWGGIRFIDTPSTNDSSKILYCKLQYGKANTGSGYYDRWGGALCAKINKLLISHCRFRKNTCYHTIYGKSGGGAIAIVGNPVVEFCEFSESTSPFGGGMMIWGSNLTPLIRNNYFHHNQGHGIINIGSFGGNNTSPVLINNIIVNNNSIEDNSPGGHGIINISNGGGVTVLINNTIINNSCDISGSALCIHLATATPLLINNIIYGNTPAQVRLNVPSGLDFINCLIEGGKEGFSGSPFIGTYENCIDVDPLFVSSNDFHLQDKSNCIGAAIDSVLINSTMYYCPPTDYEGNPRPNSSGSMPDIGAYENPLTYPAHTEIPAGDVSGTWTKTNSPYNINGEITIPNDSTLIIEPGVEVIFTGHYKFNVQGRLLAIGTETDTIVFTINDTTGFHHLTLPDGGWHGIKILDIASSNDSTIFEYCTFEYGKSNTGSGIVNRSGGAINTNLDKLRISHCLFRNNKSYSTDTWEGTSGAILNAGNGIIENCEFSWNESSWGSAMCVGGNTTGAIIRNNHFHHNTGHGTINVCLDAYPTIINNIIEYNHTYGEPSTPHGHGILHFSNNNNAGYAKIINNTIVNNTNVGEGGGIFVRDGNPTFINNIIYGNEPSEVNFLWPSSVDFRNCLIEGGKEGFTGAAFTGKYENCIDADPLFIDMANGDYHLSDVSPCIGTGYYEEGLTPTCDCEGNLRPVGSNPDIGAFENELATDIMKEENQLPTKFELSQNYPNPFNPSTTIKYSIPSLSVIPNLVRDLNTQIPGQSLPVGRQARNDKPPVTLHVYNILGREVATLVNEKQNPGYYEVEWNAKAIPSGVYFYKLTAGEFTDTKKFVLLK